MGQGLLSTGPTPSSLHNNTFEFWSISCINFKAVLLFLFCLKEYKLCLLYFDPLFILTLYQKGRNMPQTNMPNINFVWADQFWYSLYYLASYQPISLWTPQIPILNWPLQCTVHTVKHTVLWNRQMSSWLTELPKLLCIFLYVMFIYLCQIGYFRHTGFS